MDFPRATLATTRGHRYSYIHIPPSSNLSHHTYMLFLHGFPSLASDWHSQIAHFSSLGYGILAPDLLGYGASASPTDTDSYRHKLVIDDLVEILDHHDIQSPVNGVAHDFGVPILTRLELYHPKRVGRMAFLTIGYSEVGQAFDLEAVNSMTKQMLGYEGYGYIQFLTQDPDAASLLAEHHDSFISLTFAKDQSLWRENFGALGGLKRWLTQDEYAVTLPCFDPYRERAHRAAFAHTTGYTGAVKWYTVQVNNLNQTDDEARLAELGVNQYSLSSEKPLLLILAAQDCIALDNVQKQMTEPYSDNLKVKVLNTGHWTMLEMPSEVNELLEQHFI